MRVLFSVFPGWGHIQPMLPLAIALRDRGNEVLFATNEEARALVEGAGIELVAAGPGVGPRALLDEAHRRYPEAAELPGPELPEFMFPHLFGEVTAPLTLPPLLSVANRWQPDVIVHDCSELAGPIVAAKLGIPNAVHSFGAVLPPTRIARASTFVEPLWRDLGLEPRPYAGCFEHLYLDIYPPSMQRPGDHAHLGRVQGVRSVSSGQPADDELPPAIAAEMTGDRPVVYLTFGTVFNVNPTFGAAIEALARRPDLVAVVTVGPQGDPGVFGALPGHVHVERYIRQEALLPRCATVLSHGGSGTVLGTLAHGLPQVVLPQAADQFLNAQACAAAGVGLALGAEEATVDRIGAALSDVLARDDLRAGARRLQAEIAAMPSPDEAAAVIEALSPTTG